MRLGQREQVVPAEQRLEDDVVERERKGSPEDEQRAPGTFERQARPLPSATTTTTPANATVSPTTWRTRMRSRPTAGRQCQAHAGASATTSAAIPEVV
jgi:hypothetical protein